MTEESQSDPDKQLDKLTAIQDWKKLLTILLSLAFVAILPFFEPPTQNIETVFVQPLIMLEEQDALPVISSFQENTALPTSETFIVQAELPIQKIPVIITAYSSTVWQTDDTPYITAAGTYVRTGIVAANFLPFGTKIKIPEIYDDAIFIVEDRMHPKNNGMVDIWFPTYWQALNFGAKTTYVEVL